MATGIFYLRPSADISLGHKVYPDTLTAGYLAISEEVSDGTSTYLTTSNTDSLIGPSTFGFSGNKPEGCDSITNFTLVVDYFLSISQGTFVSKEVSGIIYFGETEIAEYSCSSSVSSMDILSVSLVDVTSSINEYIKNNGSFPDIRASVEFAGDVDSNDSGKSTHNHYLTQMYIVVEFETDGLNIYHKANGAWTQAQAAYQKQNGVWVEITEDECKNILSGSFCTKTT